jgi:hypothetical protein
MTECFFDMYHYCRERQSGIVDGRRGVRIRFAVARLLIVATCLVVLTPDEADGFAALDLPTKSILCPGLDMRRVLTFRRVQAEVRRLGTENVFTKWDGIDDSVPDDRLTWKEMRMGLRTLVMYDPYGDQMELSSLDMEFIVREIGDDDSEIFQQSGWGTSFQEVDANKPETVLRWEAGRPRNLMDGGPDNAYCFDGTYT